MAKFISWVTVENSANRKKLPSRQKLRFVLRVANLAYHKQVDVLWAGLDGVWRTLAAEYLAAAGNGAEFWQAEISLKNTADSILAGDVQFALRLRADGLEYWDNGDGGNYSCAFHSGIHLHPDLALQRLDFSERLSDGQEWLELKLAVNPLRVSGSPVLHWSADNWRHQHKHSFRLNKRTARAATQIWSVRLKIGQGFRVQYAIAYQAAGQSCWDNNHGQNYQLSRTPLQIMILNLHCYQETDQQQKFRQIAKAIDELAVDVVCLQEVAEHWNEGCGDWPSNAANIINQQLKQPFHLYYDWSHLGFDRYREGVAILSRHSLRQTDSGYVSTQTDPFHIHARKVVTAQINLPYFGVIQLFSVHLSWWEDGFQQQFQRLTTWADHIYSNDSQTAAVLLCGDFNITAGSKGYWQVVADHHYQDAYLQVNRQGLTNAEFRVNDAHWGHDFSEDYRIDYIFSHPRNRLQVTAARTVFTAADYGRVSDHCGYLMTFEPE